MAAPQPPPQWTGCMHFLPHKKRYCSGRRLGALDYCGMHAEGAPDNRRVPCPVDASHAVFERNLRRHVRFCNATRDAAALAASPCYRLRCNAGGASDEDARAVAALRSALGIRQASDQVEAEAVAADEAEGDDDFEGTGGPAAEAALAEVGRGRASRLASDAALAVVDSCELVRKLARWLRSEEAERNGAETGAGAVADAGARPHAWRAAASISARPSTLCCAAAAPLLAAARALGGSATSRKGLLRHAIQQASLASHMLEAGLLEGDLPPVFVEFGAGSAMLSLTLASCVPGARLVLVDRSARVKGKSDTAMRRAQLQEQALEGAGPGTAAVAAPSVASMSRVKMDIEHLHLRGCAELWPAEIGAATSDAAAYDRRITDVVAVGKHLCGGATDLSLRCLARAFGSGVAHWAAASGDDGNAGCVEADEAAVVGSQRLLGVAIATCCHHRCSWESFVGKRWWRRAVCAGAAEFEAAAVMAAWAVTSPTSSSVPADASTPAEQVGPDALDALAARNGAEPDTGPWLRQLSLAERMCIGRACKLAIDCGRADFAEQALGGAGAGAARLVRYCEREVSPENALLLLGPAGR